MSYYRMKICGGVMDMLDNEVWQFRRFLVNPVKLRTRIPCKRDLNFRVALNAPLSTNSMSVVLLPSELV